MLDPNQHETGLHLAGPRGFSYTSGRHELNAFGESRNQLGLFSL